MNRREELNPKYPLHQKLDPFPYVSYGYEHRPDRSGSRYNNGKREIFFPRAGYNPNFEAYQGANYPGWGDYEVWYTDGPEPTNPRWVYPNP